MLARTLGTVDGRLSRLPHFIPVPYKKRQEETEGTMADGGESPPETDKEQQTTSVEGSSGGAVSRSTDSPEATIDLSEEDYTAVEMLYDDPHENKKRQEETEGTMADGEESPPETDKEQQTTSVEGSSGGAVSRSTDSPESTLDLSEEDYSAVEMLYDDPYEAFSKDIEPFLGEAETYIVEYRFDLWAAKRLVAKLRELVKIYESKGCTECSMEAVVIERILNMVALATVKDENQEEMYEPQQTMTYLLCAMAVFPCTVHIIRMDGRRPQYGFSRLGSMCFIQWRNLKIYFSQKVLHFGHIGHIDVLQHSRLLLDLAAWLELDMTPVAYMIAWETVIELVGVLRIIDSVDNVVHASPEREKLQRMIDIGRMVTLSCQFRLGLNTVEKNFHHFLLKVDVNRLPPSLAVRHAYVYASLLQNCGENMKALEIAQKALEGVKDEEMKWEFGQLITRITESVETACKIADISGPADPQWLEGTNALTVREQTRTDVQDSVREHYLTWTGQKKDKTVPVRKRGQTPSPAPSASGHRPRGATPNLRNKRRRSSSRRYSSSSQPPSLYSNTSASVSCCSAKRNPPQIGAAMAASSSVSGLDDSFDEEVFVDREIRFPYMDDQNDGESAGVRQSASEQMLTPQPLTMEDEPEDDCNWFEKSEIALANGEADEDEEEGIELSEEQKDGFKKGGRGKIFYPALAINDKAESLLRNDPIKYKRCQLKIEQAHKSIARVLDSGSEYSEIVIEGRSKAGQTYMDDEVVVEITEPGRNPAGADESIKKLAHGKVVGFLKRVNYSNVDYPVLFCTLDEMEGHLMKPLCKTVPKIHVMSELVKKKFPALRKNRVELKKISERGEVKHTGFFTIEPDKREQYVFKVVILSWRPQNIYPLGAVLSAYIGGRNYSGGLQVLSMQQKLPRRYPRLVLNCTKVMLEQTTLPRTGREDLTGERTFTIDPPGSKDLDDAVSIQKRGTHWVIGVHIADVAAVVRKDSEVDKEAKKRAVTFYPLNRRPHAMLPEPLSHGKCSLREGEERLALSVFFTFNDKGKQVGKQVIKKTIIKSCCQLTYEEAQKIIDQKTCVDVDAAVQNDIQQLHKITSLLKEKRQKQSMLFVPFEDPRLSEIEKVNEHMEAHSLIEELMILANAKVADYITKQPRYRNVMLVRCHKAPTWQELQEWKEKEGSVTNLVMQLQGKTVSPSGQQLSFSGSSSGKVGEARHQQKPVVVQKSVWEKLCQCLEQGDLDKARKLAFMDALHPLQCLAACRWMDLMDRAQYRCCYGLNGPDRRHFGLDLDVYTHFTSPIRRYTDLHVQRLLHACLDGITPDCTPDDVTALCQHANSATARQKAFSRGCMSLKLSESLQHQPLVFKAYVDGVDTDQLTLIVPSLLKLSDRKQELPFSMLGVSCQPELITDTALRKDSVTVQWNRRIYDKNGFCPSALRLTWEHLNRSSSRNESYSELAQTGADKKNKKAPPFIMYINPDQLSESVRHSDWVRILHALTSAHGQPLESAPLPLERVPRSAYGQDRRDYVEVDHMTCENGNQTVSVRPVQFKKVYTEGQVLQVQISAESKKGLLKPRVEMLQITCHAGVCTQHVSDPVCVLTNFATCATRDQQFKRYDSYLQAWMPLLEMEAAMEAGNGDGCLVIDNVPVALKKQESNKKLLYRGTFTLDAKFCFDRCIDFGGKSSDTIKEEEIETDNFFPLDYLCLRYKTKCPNMVLSRAKESGLSETVDGQYIWLAHGSVVRVNRIGKGAKNGDGQQKEKQLLVTFVLATSSPQPPPQLLSRDGDKVTLELLRKSEADRRAQMMLLSLKNPECKLAQDIAFGRTIPKLDSDHKRLGHKPENHEVTVQEATSWRLPPNNAAQEEAIQMALTNSLTLVQGPPGTGKTNTGIKLVYLFCKINGQLEAEGKGKKTVLYCGPSNKSVDLVARELRIKLGSKCPKIVRVYGSAIERKDYPMPRGDLNSSRNMRDLQSDPSLRAVTLHHLIRECDRPNAEDINRFDRHFEMCIRQPHKYSVTSEELQKYKALLHLAALEELTKYEVILTTICVGGNGKLLKGTKKSIYQVIIDECAMSTEPQSMVPIIATQAKQVVLIGDHKQLRPIIKCQPAAELGLDQSLFERLFTKFPAYTVFLSIQYRMHPQICAFPSVEFYDGMLETGHSKLWTGPPLKFWPRHPISDMAHQVTPHLLIDVRGTEETLTVTTDDGNERSKSNSLEAQKVIDILTFLKREGHVESIGQVKIMTQYNAQRSLLERRLKELCQDRSQQVFDCYDTKKLQISTVVSSQGGEWDYVILSTVRSIPSHLIEPNPTHGWCRQNLGFITDRNQVNVALTRARQGLFIVGNVELLRCDDVWRNLVERYERLNCVIQDPELFPPPPAPRRKQKRRQLQRAENEWQQV